MSNVSEVVNAIHFPKLSSLLAVQYERTPGHRKYLETRLARATPEAFPVLEDLADQISALAGDRLSEICDNYDFICKIVREEEMFFRRKP